MNSIGEKRVGGKSGVGVLDKAVGVLSFLAEDGPATLAGVVRGTGLARPTAYRLLSALEAHGVGARGGGRHGVGVRAGGVGGVAGRCGLGLRLLSWGGGAGGSALIGAAAPVLAALRDRTGES